MTEEHKQALQRIADMPVESDEWDGAEKYRLARECAANALASAAEASAAPVDARLVEALRPVAWYEAEESCRGMPLHVLLSESGLLCHSGRFHGGRSGSWRPATSNPVWPLYASSAAALVSAAQPQDKPPVVTIHLGRDPATGEVLRVDPPAAQPQEVALTDEEIDAIAARIGSRSLHATRAHELGGITRTIFDPEGLVEFARAILAASRKETP